MNRVTSPRLQAFRNDVHGLWSRLAMPEKFNGVYVEDLLPLAYGNEVVGFV